MELQHDLFMGDDYDDSSSRESSWDHGLDTQTVIDRVTRQIGQGEDPGDELTIKIRTYAKESMVHPSRQPGETQADFESRCEAFIKEHGR